MDNGFAGSQDSPSDINLLKQNFSKLSVDGQSQLKDYLQSLVFLQNTLIGTKSADNIHVSSNENKSGN